MVTLVGVAFGSKGAISTPSTQQQVTGERDELN
jgi:hypothetical protein